MSNKQLDIKVWLRRNLGIHSTQMTIAGMNNNKITPQESVQSRKRRGLRKNPGEQ